MVVIGVFRMARRSVAAPRKYQSRAHCDRERRSEAGEGEPPAQQAPGKCVTFEAEGGGGDSERGDQGAPGTVLCQVLGMGQHPARRHGVEHTEPCAAEGAAVLAEAEKRMRRASSESFEQRTERDAGEHQQGQLGSGIDERAGERRVERAPVGDDGLRRVAVDQRERQPGESGQHVEHSLSAPRGGIASEIVSHHVKQRTGHRCRDDAGVAREIHTGNDRASNHSRSRSQREGPGLHERHPQTNAMAVGESDHGDDRHGVRSHRQHHVPGRPAAVGAVHVGRQGEPVPEAVHHEGEPARLEPSAFCLAPGADAEPAHPSFDSEGQHEPEDSEGDGPCAQGLIGLRSQVREHHGEHRRQCKRSNRSQHPACAGGSERQKRPGSPGQEHGEERYPHAAPAFGCSEIESASHDPGATTQPLLAPEIQLQFNCDYIRVA